MKNGLNIRLLAYTVLTLLAPTITIVALVLFNKFSNEKTSPGMSGIADGVLWIFPGYFQDIF